MLKKISSVFLSVLVTVSMFVVVLDKTTISASASTSNNWAWPASVQTIKSDWPTYSSGSYHGGTDFPVALNSPVYSTCDGEVVDVKTLTTSYGKHIKIKAVVNGSVVYMRYCHLNSFAVSVGDKVTAGQLIGYSGSTGNSTGPHLHYEVRNSNDTYGSASSPNLNPRNYLPGTSYTFECHSPNYVDVGTDFYAYIINVAPWKLLTTTSNNNVVLWNETTCANQIWKFERQSDGSYKIINTGNGYCLDVDNASNSSGTNVKVCEDNATDAQRWYIYGESGNYTLKAKCTDCVLDVCGGGTEVGTNLQMWDKNDTDAQKFQIWKLENKSFAKNIGDEFTAPILNLSNWIIMGVDAENDNVELQHEDGSSHQLWKFKRQIDGSYEIYSCYNGKCLDVREANCSDGANVQVFNDHDHDAQRWYIYEYSGGYLFQSKYTGKYLDVTYGNMTAGTNIQMYTYNGSNAQVFAIYRGDECKLSAATLDIQNSAEEENIKFNWTKVYGETMFDITLWNGKAEEGNVYKKESDIPANTTTYELELPAGYFEGYIQTKNYFDTKNSNTVSFTVQPKLDVETDKLKTSISWDKVLQANTYNIFIYNTNTNEVVKILNSVQETNCVVTLEQGEYFAKVVSDNGISSYDKNFVVENRIFGDLDGNGKVTVVDSLLIQKSVTGINTLTDEQQQIADINNDGSISNADAIYILRYTIGCENEFGIGEEIQIST